ncbi:flagellar basal-body rod protein FlgF [Natronospora cellulosivora (SeqCode)]
MFKGIFTSASGMKVNQERLNITANNLANVDTNGFKRDESVQRSFREELVYKIEGNKATPLGRAGAGVMLESTYTQHQQAPLRKTGNQLDIAIEGSGFFVIDTPDGLRYTRDGSFTINNEGIIVTHQGYPVLGEGGPLETISDRDITIDNNGQIHLEEMLGDSFQIVDFAEANLLEKVGDNLYQANEEIEEIEANYQLRQGYLENSNVNIVQEMVNMIQVTRHYEANQKVITTMDNILDQAVNSIARLG